MKKKELMKFMAVMLSASMIAAVAFQLLQQIFRQTKLQ